MDRQDITTLYNLLDNAKAPSRALDVAIARVLIPLPDGYTRWIAEDDPWCNDRGDVLAPETSSSVDASLALMADVLPGAKLESLTNGNHGWSAGLWSRKQEGEALTYLSDSGFDVEYPSLAIVRAIIRAWKPI